MQSQDKRAEIEHFSRLATKDFGTYTWNDRKFERVLIYLHSINKKKILDLGCGVGNFTSRLLSLGFTVIGCDLSLSLINVNKQKNREANFICGDAEFLPFSDSSFDTILITFLLHHFKKHDNILFEIYRVLKWGGVVLCAEPNSWNPVSWYRHNTKSGRKKYFDSINEKIFSSVYLLKLFRKKFHILDFKTINFDFVKFLAPLENLIERLPFISLFGANTVIFAKK
jgi:ubiquinone/menaquinone biosynthesis C-methylase UbiE